MSDERHGYTVKIPQNVSIPDKIMFGATVRQCLILGGAAAGLWLAWLGLRPFVPPLLFAAPAGLFLLLLGIAVSAERDGVTADRLLASAVRQAISPRRRAMAPEGIGQAPAFITEALCRQEQPPVAPLGLPVQAVRDGGVLDLGVDGTAVIAEATTVNFALRTPAEQELLVSGFARWLNSLTGPVQITSRTAPADLTSQIDALRQNAPEMPHPLLEAAALNHADFLARVNDSGTILHRSLLLTAHESDREHSPRAMRRINDATGLLAACEIDATPLDHPSAHRILSAALDPDQQ